MKTYLNINSIQDKSIPGSKLEESYVSQENGKGLSTNDFTDVLKNKLLSLNNYDDSELNEKILKLEQNLNSILGEGSTEAIENFNEIISFLSGIEDSESLDNIIAAIELQISDKQDKINDLQKIREGASKGETALQDIPEEYITEDELENKGYLTEHQDITPEILQNENKVAIKVGNNTSNYTTINYSKFSNDLTGRIEATPEEFTFRPSAGDKSIRDESAQIKKIKGNTIVWNQVATFRGSTTLNGLTITNENNILRVSGTLSEALSYDILILTKYLPQGLKRDWRKYLISLNAPNGVAYGINGYPIVNTKPHFWSDKADTVFYGYISIKIPVGTTVDYVFSNPQIIDLTKMFGAGNEPATVEEFKALFPNDYYDYNAGELVSMTSNGLFANGFNQFNGEYVEVLPNNTYYLGGTYTTIGFTDEVGGTLEDITIPTDKLYTPTKKGYIYATGTNININLSHTGVRNGEYEPYWDATKDLSIIQKYFPNGMRSAGSIYDEISFDKATQKWVAIQRVGSVDLGSLNWTELTTTQENVYRFYSTGLQQKIKKTTSTRDVANLLCVKYDTTYADYTYAANKGVSLNQNGTIIIFEPSITSEDGAISFKSAMSDVMLYYELAEPIITTIEEPVDLSYKVGDFGIEKMLSDSFSAPFKADIIYQFNATDRVRENSMNISKLSKKQNLLENEVDALESKVLTTEEQNFSNDQKAQVATNLGGNTDNGLVRYVESTIPAKSFIVKDSSGTSHKYVFPIASDDEKNSATGGVLVTKSELDAIINEIYNLWYGIEWDVTVSTTQCTRIGNSDLHKSLPIQNKMRGCILNDNGEVVQYLDDWLSATRDGSIGQVMVEIPEHYRKFEEEGTIRRCKLSLYALPNYHKVPKMYIAAYEATVQRSTTKLCSVVNTDADYRGGNNNSAWDGTYRTLLGRPATVISRTNFRKYARNRNGAATAEWNCQAYEAYKALFWLYVIEYANSNCQLPFNAEKDANGYAQGGLGNGVTTMKDADWSSYFSYYPFVPCGHTDELGNGSGEVAYEVPKDDGTVLATVYANRYRGVENPFGHIWKWTDGINIKISPTEENGGDNTSKVFVADDPANYNDSNYDGYSMRGLEARENGYVKELIFGEFGDIMPAAVGGGSTTYYADYHYTNIPTAEALRGVLFGGYANRGAYAGFGYACSDRAPSTTAATIGSRLCFIPRHD